MSKTLPSLLETRSKVTQSKVSHRKARRTFTLSPDSILFLETIHRQQCAASVSAVLDDIIQGLKRAQEGASLDRAVTNYYSGLSDTEADEQIRWGEFSLGELLAQGPA